MATCPRANEPPSPLERNCCARCIFFDAFLHPIHTRDKCSWNNLPKLYDSNSIGPFPKDFFYWKTYFPPIFSYSLRNMSCFDAEHICFMIIETFCFGLRENKFSKVENFPRSCLGIELINICFISFYFPRPYSAKDELNGRFPRLSPYL